jgi:hypothetical protein
VTAILIACAFVALVAIPAVVAVWFQKEPLEEVTPRTASQLHNFSASAAANRG